MKIAHVTHPFIPNMGYQENHLPAAQQDLGHRVTVFTSAEPPISRESSHNFSAGEYIQDGVKVVRLPTPFKIKTTDDVFLDKLVRSLSRFSPDIVHCHGLMAPYITQVVAYCFGAGVPLVVDDHTDDDNFSISNLKNRLLFNTYRRVIFPLIDPFIDKYLSIHQYSKTFLSTKFGVCEDRISLLPLGVDQEEFYSDKTLGREYRRELDISPDDLLIITSGHLDPMKQTEDVISAVAELTRDGHNLELLVVGPGSDTYLEDLHQHAKNSSIGDRVTFYGFADREELLGLYNAADVGVWPGIGVSINEAIGTGLPVIIGDNQSTKHLVEHGNGFTFSRSDHNELSERIEQYICNDGLLSRHSDNALEYTQKELSWQSIAESSIKVYNEIR